MIALDDAAWAGPWRQIRVGEKVLLAVGLVLTALLAPVWPASPLVVVAVVVLALGPARIPVRVLGLGAAAPLGFIVLGALSVAVRVGEPAAGSWWAIGPLSMDAATAEQAAGLVARSSAGSLALLLLAMTTPMVDLLAWIRRWGVPGALVEVASLVYRLLFVLLETAHGLRAAQVARLGDAPAGRGSLRRRYAMVATAMGTLLVRAWDRAERLTAGLAARGLDGELITLPRRLPASPRFIAGTVVLLGLIWGACVWASPSWATASWATASWEVTR